MSNYNYIINPETGKKVNINSKLGTSILLQYKTMIGGSRCSKYKKTIEPKCNNQTGCNWIIKKGCHEDWLATSKWANVSNKFLLLNILNNYYTKEGEIELVHALENSIKLLASNSSLLNENDQTSLPLSNTLRRELITSLMPIQIDDDGEFTQNTLSRHEEFPNIKDWQIKNGWDIPR